jgi:gluconate kinase
VGDLAGLVHDGIVDELADRWDWFDRLPEEVRDLVNERRLIPVDETRRMLRDMLRCGWENW